MSTRRIHALLLMVSWMMLSAVPVRAESAEQLLQQGRHREEILGDLARAIDSYETRRLYADIRYCIDLVHRDDSLKSRVRADMERYIDRDPLLPQALHRLRSSGKTLFVLTNSDLSYTEAVMSYLLEGEGGYEHWEDFFESVWVTARKPLFFDCREPAFVLGARSFEKGGRHQLEARLGVSGDQILYVGDHIYGDVLKASSTTGWRTALVVPELEAEVGALETEASALAERAELEAGRLEMESALAAAELELRAVRRAERRLETHRNGNQVDDEDKGLVDGRNLGDVVAQRDGLRKTVAELRSQKS